MTPQAEDQRVEPLKAFVGGWSVEAVFPAGAPVELDLRGRTTFEWLSGRRFLVQRWEVPHPDAPDGIAIIGFDEGRRTYLQHYFDSRGVARVYAMTLEGDEWTLRRTEPDFSPLDFWQRFAGRFAADGGEIRGRWETSRDEGASWQHDFDLVYRKVA